jgi:uncharacterized membrane protein
VWGWTTVEQQTNSTVNNDLVFGILCYLGILWIIPLLVNKKNEFFRLHLAQGLVVLILELILAVLGRVPLIRYVAGWFWFLPGLISVLAIIKMLTGDTMYHLPVVYDISRSFKF